MTAAHCIRGHSNDSEFQIMLGQSDLNAESPTNYQQVIEISHVEPHPDYDNVSAYYDIGLIFTEEDIEFNIVTQPLCLSDQTHSDTIFLNDKSVYLAGWGRGNPLKKHRDESTLRQIQLTVFNQDYCYDKYDISGGSDASKQRKKFLPDKFTEQNICAGSLVRLAQTLFLIMITVTRIQSEI